MQTITIVDYGMGNLRSVQKALERIGAAAEISSDLNRIAEADKLILPGVGAFCDAIRLVRQTGMAEVVRAHIRADKPLLGICLGLQLLFERSFEDGEHDGLGWLAGDVVRFPRLPGLKVPHMGWNQIRLKEPCPLLTDIPNGSHFYFTHSYYVRPTDQAVTATETDYPTPFTSMIATGRLFATQFHPEKSQQIGLKLLRNFAKM